MTVLASIAITDCSRWKQNENGDGNFWRKAETRHKFILMILAELLS